MKYNAPGKQLADSVQLSFARLLLHPITPRLSASGQKRFHPADGVYSGRMLASMLTEDILSGEEHHPLPVAN
jgi:hypothetical protein